MLSTGLEDPSPSTDWIQVHKERLLLAHQMANRNLQEAAARRKKRHDAKIHGEPLRVGQRVLQREHKMGSTKIQDAWKPEVYRVVQAPEKDGAPYVVEPEHGGSPHRVTRSELKACNIPEDEPRCEPVVLPLFETTQEQSSESSSAESENSERPGSRDDVDFHQPVMQPAPRAPSSDSDEEPLPRSESEERKSTVRRSRRQNAGKHSNPHRLPRTAVTTSVAAEEFTLSLVKQIKEIVEVLSVKRGN